MLPTRNEAIFLIILFFLMIRYLYKHRDMLKMDEHDLRALELKKQREKEEKKRYKAERKRMIKEWDKIKKESKKK